MVDIVTESVIGSGAQLGTLAAATAVQIAAAYNAVPRAFLLKKARVKISVTELTAGDVILVGLAYGGLSVVEIAEAITEESTTRADSPTEQAITHRLVADLAWVVDSTDSTSIIINETMSGLGGGKGIPFPEDVGWQWYAFNMTSGALTTGADVRSNITFWGAWLGE